MTNGGLRRPTDGSPRSTYGLLRQMEAEKSDVRSDLRTCQMTSHRLQKAAEDIPKPAGVISELAPGVADTKKILPTSFSNVNVS